MPVAPRRKSWPNCVPWFGLICNFELNHDCNRYQTRPCGGACRPGRRRQEYPRTNHPLARPGSTDRPEHLEFAQAAPGHKRVVIPSEASRALARLSGLPLDRAAPCGTLEDFAATSGQWQDQELPSAGRGYWPDLHACLVSRLRPAQDMESLAGPMVSPSRRGGLG